MGDLSDDDRHHGMGIVVEYAGRSGKPQWIAPHPYKWNYAQFGHAHAPSQNPDEGLEMTFASRTPHSKASTDGLSTG